MLFNRRTYSACTGIFAVNPNSFEVIFGSDCNKAQITKDSVEMAKFKCAFGIFPVGGGSSGFANLRRIASSAPRTPSHK